MRIVDGRGEAMANLALGSRDGGSQSGRGAGRGGQYGAEGTWTPPGRCQCTAST
jgi:hypothetical protein